MKMESRLASKLALAIFFGALIISAPAGTAFGELQIVEMMYDTFGTGDNIYEWIEVRNTGATEIDLAGIFMDDFDPNTQAIPITGNPSVPLGATDAKVPVGGVAVLIDTFLGTGSAANNDVELFRTSWGLAPEVKLIAADFFPNLNNTSPGSAPNNYVDNIGIWPNQAAYELDVDRGPTNPPPPENDDDDRVVSIANTIAHQYYQTTSPWPGTTQGQSIQWNGVGDRTDGANWYASVSGENGATTNAPIDIVGAAINSSDDLANPGIVPGGTAPSALIFTELLYNPQSPELTGNNWEWAEVLNNTGSAIDFATTPYWFGDISSDPTDVANLTAGAIPQGGVAVLFHGDDLTAAQMQAAWGAGINFIPVSNYPALNNGGDSLGLWDNETDFVADTTADPNLFTNTVATVTYDEGAGGWPEIGGSVPGESIYLSDLSLDPTLGASWVLASTLDGISYSPDEVTGVQNIHPGGDQGSPGSFVIVEPGDADYNEDGTIDAADYVTWRKLPGDFDGDPAGYTAWKKQFGQASAGAGGSNGVPEPAGMAMLAIGLAALCLRRRGA